MRKSVVIAICLSTFSALAQIVVTETGNNKSDIAPYYPQKVPSTFRCHPNMPTIDLEAPNIYSGSSIKGPFYGIGRDHQDGLGTCFANTGKNLLVALTKGKADASFLDMALQYQIDQGKLLSDLNGGNACWALSAVKRNGYCPKALSPIESGDSNQAIGGIFGDTSNLADQARILNALRNFLRGKGLLEGNKDKISKTLLSKTRIIIEKLKADPHIKLPIPTLIDYPLDKKAASNLYYTYKRKMKSQAVTVTEEAFLNEFEVTNNQFISELMQSFENAPSAKNIQNLFHQHFASFAKKYQLSSRLEDKYYKRVLIEFFEKNQGDTFKKNAAHTLQFYREILDPNMTEEEMKNLFNTKCNSHASDYSIFTDGLKNLISLIGSSTFNPQMLYDSHGKLIDNHKLLQLAIAPQCLNPKNRKAFDIDYSCKVVYANQYKNKRQDIINDVVTSLLKGLPVGNTFKAFGNFAGNGNSHHINTIVGYRYNPNTKRCDFKIRESQTGGFYWSSAESEVNKLERISIVENSLESDK